MAVCKHHGNHKSKVYNRYTPNTRQESKCTTDNHQITREQMTKKGTKKNYKRIPKQLTQ